VTAAAILAVLAAAAIGAVLWPLNRAKRLERLLEEHERSEADLEAMVDATREPPPLTDEQADELARLLRRNEEPQ
jgi:type II secretory pathway pseudopilin PulG